METPAQYLRSANRSAMIPQDKSWLVGFRVVQAKLPGTKPLPVSSAPLNRQHVNQQKYRWARINKPVFKTPIPYVQTPGCETKVPFYQHNHCPAITWCPNGDLLAIWFSTNAEAGREMEILGSRLRAGKKQWDVPSLFFKVPDRNMTGSSLFCDHNRGEIFYMNGVEAAGSWQNLAMVLRTSNDNGASWSLPVLADPNHVKGNQVIAGMFKSREGWLIQAVDATPGGEGGSLLHISKDCGKSWNRTNPDTLTPSFEAGDSGGLIAGIHAGVVQLKNGNLLAFGRGNNINGHMPMSISADMGSTWKYDATEFPPIAGGQRLVLSRLNEGPLLLISFTNHPAVKDSAKKGMSFKDSSGNYYKGFGLCAALSFDEGKTWPVKKLITDGKMRYLYGQAWTGTFRMDKSHAEPMGYMALTESPDNMIHLISSGIHYSFNLQWLMEPVNLSVNTEFGPLAH